MKLIRQNQMLVRNSSLKISSNEKKLLRRNEKNWVDLTLRCFLLRLILIDIFWSPCDGRHFFCFGYSWPSFRRQDVDLVFRSSFSLIFVGDKFDAKFWKFEYCKYKTKNWRKETVSSISTTFYRFCYYGRNNSPLIFIYFLSKELMRKKWLWKIDGASCC